MVSSVVVGTSAAMSPPARRNGGGFATESFVGPRGADSAARRPYLMKPLLQSKPFKSDAADIAIVALDDDQVAVRIGIH